MYISPGCPTRFFDVGSATYACDTTGSVTLLNGISVGDGLVNTTAAKCWMKGLTIRGNFSSVAATTITSATIVIVYDAMPRGALPTIADMFVDAAGVVSSNLMQDFLFRDRFSFLYRKTVALSGNITAPATGAEIRRVDTTIRFNKVLSFPLAATASIANIDKGALYLVTFGDVAAGTAAAAFLGGFRLYFKPAY